MNEFDAAGYIGVEEGKVAWVGCVSYGIDHRGVGAVSGFERVCEGECGGESGRGVGEV